MLKSTEHEISTAHKIIKDKDFFTLELPDVLFILLINVKMQTIVGILTSLSRINEKSCVFLKLKASFFS